MPKIVSYSLSATATELEVPAEASAFREEVSGTFVTPASPTIGLGESTTAFADAMQLPTEVPVKIGANDAVHAILDTGQTHTLVVLWTGPGL